VKAPLFEGCVLFDPPNVNVDCGWLKGPAGAEVGLAAAPNGLLFAGAPNVKGEEGAALGDGCPNEKGAFVDVAVTGLSRGLPKENGELVDDWPKANPVLFSADFSSGFEPNAFGVEGESNPNPPAEGG